MKILLSALLLVASAIWSSASPISDEAAACFEWFGTLGYPNVEQAVFAEVWTGRWYQSDNKTTVVTIPGYVTLKGKDHFAVVGVDLIERELTIVDTSAKAEARVGYEARSFTEYAQQQLAHLRHPPKDHGDRFQAKIGHKTEVFFLSFVCWKKRELDLAQSLFEEASKIASFTDDQDAKPKGLRISLEEEFGHYAMWDAILQCGGGKLGVADWGNSGELVSRPELLRLFQNFAKRFPSSAHMERAKQSIAMLQRLIQEDNAHAAISDEALKKLPVDEQVKELIFRLRDQNGHQWSQPGWCDVFSTAKNQVTPAHLLLELGYDAVPQLIESMTDDRFSRSVGFHRDFHFSHTVLTIGDCAQQILNRIAGRTFYIPKTSSSYMSRDEEIAETQKVIREWWSEFEAKGERQSLVDTISSGTVQASPLVDKLKAKYPEAVADAVMTGAAKAQNAWLEEEFIALMEDIKTDAAKDFLIAKLRNGGSRSIRLAAARVLWNMDHPGVVEHIIKEWQKMGRFVSSDPESGFDATLKFLCKCGQTTAIEALAGGFEKRSTEQRLTIVETLGEEFPPKQLDHPFREMNPRPADPSAKQAVISLLVRSLEDTEKREGMSGSMGNFQYTNPRICDFALWALSQIEPEIYHFSEQATPRERDVERISAVNTWRKANGKPLLQILDAE